MKSIAQEILDIARLAEAPPRDFKPWQISRIAQVAWGSAAPVNVMTYTVPKGFSLAVTRVDSWVSEPYDPAAAVGAPKPTWDVINAPQFFAQWQSGSEIVAGRDSLYTVLGQGEQLVIFAPLSEVKFVMTNFGLPIVGVAQSFHFRFFGFLTLPEHAERLTLNQSLTP